VFASPDLPTVIFDERRFMTVVTLTASGVFLAGCATVMALLLVHYEKRRREFAIRIALGASVGGLSRLVLRELLWLSCVGTVCTAITVRWLVTVLPRFRLPNSVDFSHMDLSADWRVYAVACAGCVATVVIGAAPGLLRMRREIHAGQLRLDTVAGSRSSLRLRRAVLAAHALVATVLVITAGLFVRSVSHGFSHRIGIDVARTAFLNVRMKPMGPSNTSGRLEVQAAAVRALMERLAALPGVVAVALGPPPLGTSLERSLSVSQEVRSGADVIHTPVAWISAGPDYLRALGVRPVLGRSGVGREAVVTIGLAKKLWPDGDALGQQIEYGPFQGAVVGVIDMAVGSVRLGDQPGIVTFERADVLGGVIRDSREISLTIRSDGPPPVRAIEECAREAFLDATRLRVETAVDILDVDLGRERMGAWFFGGFGAIALALGLAGVFGLVAHTLSADRRSYGIMMALGATRHTVALKAVRTGVEPVMVGALLGALAAVPLASSFRALLIGIESTDAVTYGVSVLLFVGAAVVAGVCAVRSVSEINPIDVLRSE